MYFWKILDFTPLAFLASTVPNRNFSKISAEIALFFFHKSPPAEKRKAPPDFILKVFSPVCYNEKVNMPYCTFLFEGARGGRWGVSTQ